MGLPLAWADVMKAKKLIDEPGPTYVESHGKGNRLDLTLPLCPTTNNLFLNVGKRRVKTKAYREWSDRAAFCLKDIPAWEHGYPVAIEITIVSGKGWTTAYDVSNREKACVDAVVESGILTGDSCRYVTDVRVKVEPGRDKTMPAVMRVVIREA